MQKLIWERQALQHPFFSEVVDLALRNSSGPIWIVGGFLYRNIAAELYGSMPFFADIDICVEGAVATEPYVPGGWSLTANRYSGRKFCCSGRAVDIWPMASTSSIIRRRVLPTIDNLLDGTPLTVQSIAYNVIDDKLIGDIGMKAIQSRTIAVNDAIQAEIFAARKNKTLAEIIREKADALDFRSILP